MKTIVYIMMTILVLSTANALTLDKIKIFVEDEKVSADEDGGDFDVYRGDLVEIQIDIDNNEGNNSKAKLTSSIQDIDDGDNLEKELDYYTISAEDDKTRTITYTIPNDADYDTYELRLLIEEKDINDSESEIDDILWDIRVRKESEDENLDTQITTTNLANTLTNLSETCANVVETINGCFGYVEDVGACKDELSTVKEQRGSYESQANERLKTIEFLEGEKSSVASDIAEKDNIIAQKETQMKSMLTVATCQNTTATKVSQAKKELNNQYGMFGLAIAAGGFFWWQKRKKGSVAETYQYTLKN